MRKIVILTFLTLDGVMQAPGGKGEDPSGGFDLEGWSGAYFDDTMNTVMGEQMGQPFDLLLGKTTYDIFAGYWPDHPEQDSGLNEAAKYVVSDQPFEATWDKTTVLTGDVVAQIKELKQQDGPMLQVHGSGKLIQTLLANDLADELWLKIFPVTLGKGKRLFAEGAQPAAYKLTSSRISDSGVIVASYVRDGDVKLSSIS